MPLAWIKGKQHAVGKVNREILARKSKTFNPARDNDFIRSINKWQKRKEIHCCCKGRNCTFRLYSELSLYNTVISLKSLIIKNTGQWSKNIHSMLEKDSFSWKFDVSNECSSLCERKMAQVLGRKVRHLALQAWSENGALFLRKFGIFSCKYW